MDWKTLKDKVAPYIAKMDPYIDKTKEYGNKAAEFVEDQMQSTPLFIKTQAEYDALITEKRVIIIAYDESQPVSQDIRPLVPVWMTRAFMDTAKLRFISLTESADLSKNLDLTSPIDMRIRFQWEETLQLTTIADIKKWWQDTTYKKIEPEEPKTIDPLAGK